MASVNKAIVVGNLGRDPEMRTTQSGSQVAKFSVATSSRYKDRDGNQQEETEWHRIVAFGRLAEICGQYLHKGKQVYIEGRLQTSSWDDKETGQKRYMTEIVAQEMQMLSRAGEGNSDGPSDPYSGGQSRAAQSGSSTPAPAGAADDDDLPF